MFIGVRSYSAQKIKGSIGSKSWWNLFILSTLILSSPTLVVVTIVFVLCKFIVQFNLCKLGIQLQQKINDLLEHCFQNENLIMKYQFLLSSVIPQVLMPLIFYVKAM